MNWALALYASELKRAFSYRVEFWLSFLGHVGAQFTVAFFLWKSVYSAGSVTTLGGFSFTTIMAYYVLAPLMERVTQGPEMGEVSRDIYEGGLNRYLVYPISFFGAKAITHLAHATLAAIQLVLFAGLIIPVLGLGGQIHWAGVAWVLPLLLAGIAVQFTLSTCMELIAFWADNVWSLSVMMRMVGHLVGGSLVPLAMFPEWAQVWLKGLPFYSYIGLPSEMVLGHAHAREALQGLLISGIWATGLGLLSVWIWRRGLLRYSGVGM